MIRQALVRGKICRAVLDNAHRDEIRDWIGEDRACNTANFRRDGQRCEEGELDPYHFGISHHIGAFELQ